MIDTKDIVFNPAFRTLCEENLCGKYGVNYACPPDCGTADQMKEKILQWPRGIVLQTLWDIDPLDSSLTKSAKSRHNRLTREFIEQTHQKGLMVGASGNCVNKGRHTLLPFHFTRIRSDCHYGSS